jgi:hypothetical protein
MHMATKKAKHDDTTDALPKQGSSAPPPGQEDKAPDPILEGDKRREIQAPGAVTTDTLRGRDSTQAAPVRANVLIPDARAAHPGEPQIRLNKSGKPMTDKDIEAEFVAAAKAAKKEKRAHLGDEMSKEEYEELNAKDGSGDEDESAGKMVLVDLASEIHINTVKYGPGRTWVPKDAGSVWGPYARTAE